MLRPLLLLGALVAVPIEAPGEGAEGAPRGGPVVQGTVLRSTGEPLTGLTVELLPLPGNFENLERIRRGEGDPPAAARGETDEEGRFRLAARRVGLWRLQVSGEGFVPMERFLVPLVAPLEAAPLTLPAADTATTLVRNTAQRPVPGVWGLVETADRATLEPWERGGWTVVTRTARSDEAGRLTFPRLPHEALRLTVFVPDSLHRVEALLRTRTTVNLADTPAGPEGRREMRIVDPAGRPVADVSIAAGKLAWPVGRTDNQGRLILTGGEPAEPLPLFLFTADGRRSALELPPRAQDEADSPADLPFPAPRRLRGRVVSAVDGRPVRDAVVWPNHDPGTFVVTDATGEYTLAIPPYERFRIHALAAGHQQATVRASGGQSAGLRGPIFALQPVRTVRGEVTDPDGTPLAGVHLRLVPEGTAATPTRHDPALGRAISDAEGAFQLSGLPPETHAEILADRSGFAQARLPVPAATAVALTVVLDPTRPATGTVIDVEEQPIPGVLLRLSSSKDSSLWTAVETDIDGRFHVAQLPALTLDLETRRDGYAPLVVRGVTVPPGKGTAELGTLILQAGVDLPGRVTSSGDPVVGAEVRLGEVRQEPIWIAERRIRQGEVQATTDAQGRFALPALHPERTLHLLVSHPRYLPASLRGVRPRDSGERELSVVLEPASAVRGQVTASTGEPIPGASISLSAPDAVVGVLEPGTVGLDVARSATADAQGRFELQTVVPGKVILEARAPAFLPSPRTPLEVPPGVVVEDVFLVLERGAVLEGQVTDPTGSVVPQARVSLGADRTETDAEGIFRLTGLAAGTHRLQVQHPHYRLFQESVEVEPANPRRLEVVLQEGRRVSGRVVDEAAEPLVGAQVELELRNWRNPRSYRGTTRQDGAFLLRGVVEGHYDVGARLSGYGTVLQEGALRVPAGTDEPVEGLEIVLPRGVPLRGRILGLDFEGLAAARVAAQSTSGTQQEGTVDYEGRYTVPALTPGLWRVSATVEGGQRQAEGRVAIAEGATEASLDLEFRGLSLTGRITYGNEPLAETRIGLRGLDVSPQRSVVTDFAGRFAVHDLEPGRYEVTVSNPRELLSHAEEVPLQTSRELRIDLASVRVGGTVRSAATSRPPSEATVIFTLQVGPEARGGSMTALATDSEGRFRIERLTPGRYKVEVRAEGHAPVRQALDLRDGLDREDLDFVLEPTQGVEIHARLATGGTPESILLHVLDSDGRVVFRELRVGIPEGAVLFPTVPAGRWSVVISHPGAAAVRLPATVPGPPLTAVLPAAGRLEVTVPTLVANGRHARLTATAQDGTPFEAVDGSSTLRRHWDLEGGYTVVENLPAGVWTLTVVAVDGSRFEGVATTDARPRSAVTLE